MLRAFFQNVSENDLMDIREETWENITEGFLELAVSFFIFHQEENQKIRGVKQMLAQASKKTLSSLAEIHLRNAISALLAALLWIRMSNPFEDSSSTAYSFGDFLIESYASQIKLALQSALSVN